MKTSKINIRRSSILLLAALLISGSMLMAQGAPGRGKGPAGHPTKSMKMLDRIPNLTDAQKKQIQSLRLAMQKELMPMQNQMAEKRAHLRTLATAEKADMKAINNLIDDIAALRAKMMKRRMQFMQDMRALLTDEQRVFFDSHAMKMFNANGRKASPHHGRPVPGNCRR